MFSAWRATLGILSQVTQGFAQAVPGSPSIMCQPLCALGLIPGTPQSPLLTPSTHWVSLGVEHGG